MRCLGHRCARWPCAHRHASRRWFPRASEAPTDKRGALFPHLNESVTPGSSLDTKVSPRRASLLPEVFPPPRHPSSRGSRAPLELVIGLVRGEPMLPSSSPAGRWPDASGADAPLELPTGRGPMSRDPVELLSGRLPSGMLTGCVREPGTTAQRRRVRLVPCRVGGARGERRLASTGPDDDSSPRTGATRQNIFLRLLDERMPSISRYFATVRRAIWMPSLLPRSSTIA